MERDLLGSGKGFWVDPEVELKIKSKFLLTVDLKQKRNMQIQVVVFHKGPAVEGTECVWLRGVLSLFCSCCFPSRHSEREFPPMCFAGLNLCSLLKYCWWRAASLALFANPWLRSLCGVRMKLFYVSWLIVGSRTALSRESTSALSGGAGARAGRGHSETAEVFWCSNTQAHVPHHPG